MNRSLFAAVVLTIALGFTGLPGARALQSPATPSASSTGGQAAQSRSSSRNFLTPKTARSGNLAAAEDEDDKAVFRHSATVRGVGKLLHLDPEHAARLFEYLNFAVLAGVGLFFFLTRFPRVLRAHRETIQKRLLEARAATEKANTRLSAVEQRFARLDEEIAAIRTQAEQESLAEEARIKAVIETERQRIVTSAEQEIAASAAAARRDLKRFAGELAVDRAAHIISLTGEDDQALVRQFSGELGRGSQNGGRN